MRPLSELPVARVVRAKSLVGVAAALAVARPQRAAPRGERRAGLAACGALGYGVSLRLYLRAQQHIGAARTASVFSIAPFFGAVVALAMGARVGLATLAGLACSSRPRSACRRPSATRTRTNEREAPRSRRRPRKRALGLECVRDDAFGDRASIAFAFACACSSTDSGSDASTDAAAEAAPDSATALGKANGTLDAWQTLAPLPHARANFCATVVGSYVVAIGGNYPDDGGFTKLDEIDVARFHDDGSLDAWQVAGHAPSPLTECTAVGAGTTLFVLDGIYDDASKEGHVFSAELASNGTLGALADVGTLPSGVDLFDDSRIRVDRPPLRRDVEAHRLVRSSRRADRAAADVERRRLVPRVPRAPAMGERRGRRQAMGVRARRLLRRRRRQHDAGERRGRRGHGGRHGGRILHVTTCRSQRRSGWPLRPTIGCS